MAAAAILNFEKVLSVLYLYYSTKPHQIWRERFEFDVERIAYVKRMAQTQKNKMAAATILFLQILLPLH